mmetsp:Transcript_7973/g.22581  ORF Transcript_7973/g.22581 Transcript_7973/m.22581 type:complete len:231 (-) Transcript_7973:263-955(-)
MMLWYGNGNGVSATFAAWLKARFPSDTTCAILLRMGGAVLHMSPAGSYFWRAINRRIIHDSTMVTRARECIVAPKSSTSSTQRNSSGTPPSTFSLSRFTLASFEANPERVFLDEEVCGELPNTVILLTEVCVRFRRSGSRRKCCRAKACMRLKRFTTSSKKSMWERPMYSAHSALAEGGLVAPCRPLPPLLMEDCRCGVHTSPFASNATAMHAPSSHFAPILCTASKASQ